MDSGCFKILPFTVVIDSNESHPFGFKGHMSGLQPLIVKTVRKPLYLMDRDKWGAGLGDYSIDGYEGHIQVERKSLDDLFGSLGGRRAEFEKEIQRLNEQCDFAAVVVESSRTSVSTYSGPGPTPKSILGTIDAWTQRYPAVHWRMKPTRMQAELETLSILARWWKDFERKKLPWQQAKEPRHANKAEMVGDH
jgi:hypothetical protein